MAETDNGRQEERRVAPRYRCAGEAELVIPGRGLQYRGKIADLSTAGCFIETECRLERGTSAEIRMEFEGVPLRLAAHLLVRRPKGLGFRFSQLTPRKVEQIEGLIAELREIAAAEGGCERR
jgi:hypothetical protein